jgi:hypothetical protein
MAQACPDPTVTATDVPSGGVAGLLTSDSPQQAIVPSVRIAQVW